MQNIEGVQTKQNKKGMRERESKGEVVLTFLSGLVPLFSPIRRHGLFSLSLCWQGHASS